MTEPVTEPADAAPRIGPGMTATDAPTERAAPHDEGRPPHWRIDAAVLGIVAVLLRLPAFFTDKSLVFDDGVFAASASMRAGEAPFKTVFSSQGRCSSR